MKNATACSFEKTADCGQMLTSRWLAASSQRLISRRPFVRAVYYSSSRESQCVIEKDCQDDDARQSFSRAQNKKRAGPSHKPHPKATCPHPTRPLRPPGRRARHDYAQLVFKMQPHLYVFSMLSKTIISSITQCPKRTNQED